MRPLPTCVAGALAAALPAFHATAAPVVLKPSSQWRADFADESCFLSREFGEGEAKVLLEIARFKPGTSLSFTLASKTLKLTDAPVLYRFLPAEHYSDSANAKRVAFAEGYTGMTFDGWLPAATKEPAPIDAKRGDSTTPPVSLPSAEALVNRAEEIVALEIARAVEEPVILMTGSLANGMKLMDQCVDSLVESWGVFRDASGNFPGMATVTNEAQLTRFISEEYPIDALRKELGAVVRLRLSVGPDGKPTGCHLQTPVPLVSFSKDACDGMMRRARFEPPLDASGNPVASYYVTTVTYAIN